MREKQAFNKAKALAEVLYSLSPDNFASFSATTNPSQTSLGELRRSIMDVVSGLHDHKPITEKQDLMDVFEGHLQTAYVTNLLSEKQLQDYLAELDEIRELTNQEN